MKIGKFIGWQIKRWLPIALVLLFVFSVFCWITATNNSMSYYADNINSLSHNRFNTCLIDVYIMGAIVAFILPFFVFNYRFNRTAADAYNSFPSNRNEIRIAKVLIGLGITIAIVTIVYVVMVGILCLKYVNTPEITVINTNYRIRFTVNFTQYLVLYFPIILMIAMLYLFNCTLVSLGNTFVSSVIFVICGNIILIYNIQCIGDYAYSFNVIYYDTLNYFESAGVYNDYYLIDGPFSASCWDTSTYMYSLRAYNELVPMMIVNLVVRGGVAVVNFVSKEPSGEFYSKPGYRNNYSKVIVYGALGLMIMAITLSTNGRYLDAVIWYTLVVAGIYITLVLMNRSFKLNKSEWFAFGVLCAHLVVCIIICACAPAIHY